MRQDNLKIIKKEINLYYIFIKRDVIFIKEKKGLNKL